VLVTALMLRLGVATIIAVALGFCSFEQGVNNSKKAGEFFGIIGGLGRPQGARYDRRSPRITANVYASVAPRSEVDSSLSNVSQRQRFRENRRKQFATRRSIADRYRAKSVGLETAKNKAPSVRWRPAARIAWLALHERVCRGGLP